MPKVKIQLNVKNTIYRVGSDFVSKDLEFIKNLQEKGILEKDKIAIKRTKKSYKVTAKKKTTKKVDSVE